jgi:hypothetical protein
VFFAGFVKEIVSHKACKEHKDFSCFYSTCIYLKSRTAIRFKSNFRLPHSQSAFIIRVMQLRQLAELKLNLLSLLLA